MPQVTVREFKVGEPATAHVVRLLAKVFDDKRLILMGDKTGWEKIVESLLSEYNGVAYVADVDGTVGGAAVFRCGEWSLGKRTVKTVISQLGILGSMAANRRFKKLEKSLPPLGDDEVMVDALGVGEGHRRRGAATLLLRKGEEWAKQQGRTAICLSVKADNAPALALYKGMGYETVHSYSNVFGENYHMRKPL